MLSVKQWWKPGLVLRVVLFLSLCGGVPAAGKDADIDYKTDEIAANEMGIAIGKLDFEKAERILKSRPHLRAALDRPTLSGQATRLYREAGRGRVEVVEFLLKHGADVNKGFHVQTLTGLRTTSPLGQAVSRKRPKVVDVLLDHGADVNAGTERKPLHVAVYLGDGGLAERLIGLGADVDGCGNRDFTALHAAADAGRPEMARLILAHEPNLAARDEDGMTPLHVACEKGHLEVVNLLLDAGALVNVAGPHSMPPLFPAAEYGHVEVVKRLLAAGADADARSERGYTTVMYAVKRREGLKKSDPATKIQVLELLAAAGADVKATSEGGRNALHSCVPSGQVEVARWLVEHGVELNAKDDRGMTPLRWSRHWGNAKELREYLKSKGGRE